MSSNATYELDGAKMNQWRALCILMGAGNNACADRNGARSLPSGDDSNGHGRNGDQSLTEFERFLSKLALTLDIRRGGDTTTSLVCLRSAVAGDAVRGPEYVFTSNGRSESEHCVAKEFLSDLLDFVSKNAQEPKKKPLRKQVLWRILDFNSQRIQLYLRFLTEAVEGCCRYYFENTNDKEGRDQLEILQRRLEFFCDMETSKGTRDKFLRDCEMLINAIHSAQSTPLAQAITRHSRRNDMRHSSSWHDLRHYLGRLHSYREASEIILETAAKRPELFANPSVSFILSARKRWVAFHQQSNLEAILQDALPDVDLSHISAGIEELKSHDLERYIAEEVSKRKIKTRVHAEVHLHDYLVQQGKVNADDFWDGDMFIATSKPPCQLCHYYFESSLNEDFQVRASHMNLYSTWRLPDIGMDRSDEAKDDGEETLEDIVDHMHIAVLGLFRTLLSTSRRHDTPTNSFGRNTAVQLTIQDHRSVTSRASGEESHRSNSRASGVELHHPGKNTSAIKQGRACVNSTNMLSPPRSDGDEDEDPFEDLGEAYSVDSQPLYHAK